MSSLSDFENLVNSISDMELLTTAESLIKEMLLINQLKIKIEQLEDNLLNDSNRCKFWFYAQNLNVEQLDLGTNTVVGRKRFLTERAERTKVIDTTITDEIKSE